jgi:hypothetical protein
MMVTNRGRLDSPWVRKALKIGGARESTRCLKHNN